MASTVTITTSDLAPKEKVRYSLGTAEPFELESGGTKEVDAAEQELIACANDHPWLTVEVPAIESFIAEPYDPHVPAKDDVLAAAHGSLANDPEAAAKAEAEKRADVGFHTAIDAGLDQEEEVYTGQDEHTAQTLAAAEVLEDQAEADDKPAAKTTKKGNK